MSSESANTDISLYSKIFNTTNFIIAIVSVIAFCIFFFLYKKFFLSKETGISSFERTKLIDNTILVVSKEGCPFCTEMNNLLEDNKDKIKHNVVTIEIKGDGSRTYNHNYTGLNLEDKKNIDTIFEEMLEDKEKKGIGFPTLFKNSEIYLGRPDEKDFNNFFEINI